MQQAAAHAQETLEMVNQTCKADLMDNLRAMLRDVFELRMQGVAYARMARAHGYVDGYMRVLLETGLAERRELLAMVSEERSQVMGPASRELVREVTAVA
jgi:hypothetical protein